MKKRLLSALLALTVLLGSMPVYALEDSTPAAPDPAGMSTAETASDAAANSQVENTEVQMTEEVTVDTSDTDLPDNDELFALYMQGLMYPGGRPSLMANWGEKFFAEGPEKTIYESLKTFVQSVAQGTDEDSDGIINTEQIEFDLPESQKIYFSYEELDVTGRNDPALGDKVLSSAQKKIDCSKILDCLLVDCPADLYWYDKVAGVSYGYPYLPTDEGVTVSSCVVSMSVAEEYSSNGQRYKVDATKVQSAYTALDTATTIVNNHLNDTLYEKLKAYKDEICKLTSYNTGAAENTSTPYGNPWQLIYVFDNDPETNVVCEGYAKAFQYLCDLSGIDCYTVTGNMTGGTGAGRHMWNIVSIGGQNYLVDVTNCDENTIGNPNNLFLVGTEGDVANGYTFTIGNSNITYKYDEKIIQLYGEDILTLADSNYDPDKTVEELKINGLPATITYGDTFTLTAEGATDTVIWSSNGPVSVNDGKVTVTGAGDFTITATAGGQEDTVSGKAEAKQLTVTGATANGKPYDGTPDVTVTDVTLDGIVSDDVVSVDLRNVTGTVSSADANTYTTISLQNLALTGDKAGCYTLAATAENVPTTVTIEKATPTVPEGPFTATYGQTLDDIDLQLEGWTWAESDTLLNQIGEHTYKAQYAGNTNYTDATADLTVTVTAKTVTPTVTVEDNLPFTGSPIQAEVTVKVGDVTLTKDTDYTVSYSNNTDVGTANVTVQAVPGGNYLFDVKETFTIVKAEASAAATQNVSHRYTVNGEQQTTVQNPMPANAGTVTYSKGTAADEKGIVSSWSVQENGTVKYTLSGDGAADDTATLSVIVSSQNYEDATVNLVITLTDREVPEATAQPYIKPYDGQPVDIDKIQKDSGSIDGTWSWKDGTTAPVNVADSGTYQLVFTPKDTTNYAPVEVSVLVTINPDASSVSQAPTAVSGLTYTGESQPLVEEGTAQGGTMMYALFQDGTYSENLPTGTNAGTYTVWYKVKGDANHSDTEPVELGIVTIAKATPAVTASKYTQEYSGQPVDINAIDKNSNGIEGSWSWKEGTTAPVDVADSGTYYLVFTPNDTTNYTSAEVGVSITIDPAASSVSQAPAAVPGLTYNTQSQALVTAGTAQGGTLQYALVETGSYSENLPTATNAGDYTVWYKVVGDGNHSDTEPVELGTVTIAKATPAVTASKYTQEYSGQPVDISKIQKDSGGIDGTWSWKDGTAPVNVADSGTYQLVFTPNDTTNYAPVEVNVSVEITEAASSVSQAPTVVTGLTYTGEAHTLVEAGTAQGGTMQYALSQSGPFNTELPTATDAGTYTVWYMVAGDDNHENLQPQELGTVTIAKANPTPEIPANLTATYGDTLANVQLPTGWTWDDTSTSVRGVGTQTFSATYGETDNYNAYTAVLTVTVNPKDLSGATARTDTTKFTYNGSAQKPTITGVTLDNTTLSTDDYTVSGAETTDAGDYVLTVTGQGNYTGSFTVSYSIAKKQVTATVTAQDKIYDGTTQATVTAAVPGENLTITGLKGTFAQKDVAANLQVTIDSKDATWSDMNNYQVTIPATATASITAATYNYAGVASQEVRIGNGLDTVNATTAAAGISGEQVEGTLTWYEDSARTQALDDSYLFQGNAGATVTLYWTFTPSESATNYDRKPTTGSTEFTLTAKLIPQLKAEGLSKTYDGKAVVLDDLQKSADVAGTWSFAEGTSELKNAGDYTVTLRFVPENTKDYTEATCSVTVTIEPKPVTVSMVLPGGNRIKAGETLPQPALTYSGVLEGESLTPSVQPVFTGMPAASEAGTYKVSWTNREEMQTAIKALPAAKNYDLTVMDTSSVELVILKENVTVQPEIQAEDGKTYRVESTAGMKKSEIPESLQQKDLDTAEKIQETMYKTASEAVTGLSEENTALYDVNLYFKTGDNGPWIEATKNNFPTSGITVCLDYPEGTNAADFDFVVTHMITVAYNGYQPGDVETPAVTKTDKGIQFTVHSLSPIAISWKAVSKATVTEEQTITKEPISGTVVPAPSDSISYYTCPACGYHDWTATDEGYRCDKCGYLESVKQLSGYGNVKGIYEPKSSGAAAASAQTIPQTGDESQPVLWAVLLFASALTLGGLLVSRRKRNR